MTSADFQVSKELRGLALPAVKGAGGFFESKGESDVAWGDLLIALMTPVGGRFMRRSFGSPLYDLIFEPVPSEFQFVDSAIKDVATRLLPHILITRTEVRVVDTAIEIQIFFRVQTNRQVERRQVVFIPKTFVGAPQVA